MELTPHQKEGIQRIDEAVQQANGAVADEESDLEGAVVVGWGIVVEWMSPSGERWLSQLRSEGATEWQVHGYFFDQLHDWHG